MGEAKRRKLLDPTFGQPRFSIEILKLEDSHAVVKIGDRQQDIEGEFLFHLFYKNRKMYSELLLDREQHHLSDWARRNIDRLSELVCKQVLTEVNVVIFG